MALKLNIKKTDQGNAGTDPELKTQFRHVLVIRRLCINMYFIPASIAITL